MRPQIDRRDIIACALLTVLCLFLFRDIVFGGKRLFGSDFVAFYLSIKQFFYNEIHVHHSIPFWNPYIFGGIPFWAHFESTIFYPLGLLFWITSPEKAYGYTILLHLAFGSVFMYILARTLSLSRPGSFMAAAAFTFNCFLMATIYDGQMFRIQAYVWIPLIIYFSYKSVSSKASYFNASMAGLMWGIQILAGSPQDALYTLLAVLLFLVCSVKYKANDFRYGLKILAIIGIIFFVGTGISAIQTVPAFEFIGESIRSVLDTYDLVTIGSYPPEGIVTAVMPHFFGNYTEGNYWVSGVPWTVPLYNLYTGVLPIILLFFISYERSGTRKILLFASVLALLAFLLALGSHIPLYRLAYFLPGFDRIRAPSKIIMLWVFAFGLLAGKGLDDLFARKRPSLQWRIGFFVCFVTALVFLDLLFHFDRSLNLKIFSPFVLDAANPQMMTEASETILFEFHRLTILSLFILLWILFWFRGTFRYTFTVLSLCVLLLVDLGYANDGAVRHREEVYDWVSKTKGRLDGSIGKDKSLFRVGSYEFGMSPNIEMYLEYQTVGGYTPLILHRFYEYVNLYTEGTLPDGWVYFSYGNHKNRILMDLLNVKYEISHANRRYSIRDTCLPRAFIVPKGIVLKEEEILDNLTKPDFDPTKTVFFQEEDFISEPLQSANGNLKLGGYARITSYRPDEIVLETNSDTQGFLFLSEMFYPGWKAYLDGQPEKILRGNYLFRTIEHPEGKHVVRFVFDPLSIKVGIIITLLTLFALIIVLIQRFRRA